MITYKLSRREKVLVFALAIALVVVAWFVFVYQSTTDQITRLEGEISSTQTQITLNQARESQMQEMQAVIDQRKEEGAKPVDMPDYDNVQPLMGQLNVIMSAATTYNMTFDELSTAEDGYVERGVSIEFGTETYAASEAIIAALAGGKYPCRIDSVSIRDSSVGGRASSSKAPVSANIHVTFFEKTTI